jgi:hypothetical protein
MPSNTIQLSGRPGTRDFFTPAANKLFKIMDVYWLKPGVTGYIQRYVYETQLTNIV